MLSKKDIEEIYATVKIGNKEQLHYNGFPKVPKYMDGKTVTIIGFTKEKVKVRNEIETFIIRYDQIKRVSKAIREKEKEYIQNIGF